ncbi:S8 family serine peptidase [uncultured Maribacter sp.]|uniref:S8 family serine peptidase n=1 Tax=uncultured Maribacter sp. TaxID=431308 RepID=UPI002603934D|nr:S8 family serine peptidase [uncultured Maribacter sp.]
MKKGILFLMIVSFLLVLQSCNNDDTPEEPQMENHEPTITVSPDQMIVRFAASLSEDDRIAIRNESNVTNFKKCDCGNENIELWGIDPSVLAVESTVRGLRERHRGEAEGDYQFSFTLPNITNFEVPDAIIPSDIIQFTSNTLDPETVTIAVIDTGLDYRKYFDAGGLLYQDPGAPDCEPEDPEQTHTSGWNFIDNTGTSLDLNGHGTYVTKLITSSLEDKGIDYRIMPIQAFNENGEGSLWDIVCAIGYLQRVKAEGGSIDIVNASFGGTIEKELFENNGLLSTMIGELQNDMLFVASAGNEGIDTDRSNLRHFPSGFTAENIIGVGGYIENGSTINMHPESNYGNLSIDIAVPFDGYSIPLDDSANIDLRGTSYSAARISALVSEYYINNGKPNPINLKNQFLSTATSTPALQDSIHSGRVLR